MKRNFILFLFMISACFMLYGCSNSSSSTEEYVGEVNGIKITQAEYDERYVLMQNSYKIQQAYSGTEVEELPAEVLENIQAQTFDDLVYQKLLLKEAEDRDIEVKDDELDAAINDYKNNQLQGSESKYQEFLEQIGLNDETFRREMKMELLVSKIQQELTADVKAGEEEAKAFYDENLEMFKQPAGIQISHILVNTEEEAGQILKQLKAGEEFAQLAREFSQCGSSSQGGDLGTVNEDSALVPEFLTAALKLEPGQMTEKPVKTEFGYHIIKAGERKEASTQDFESVKNSILIQLGQQKKIQTFIFCKNSMNCKTDLRLFFWWG
jgi:parvulin-like peptidyl-prolyl isomerase